MPFRSGSYASAVCVPVPHARPSPSARNGIERHRNGHEPSVAFGWPLHRRAKIPCRRESRGDRGLRQEILRHNTMALVRGDLNSRLAYRSTMSTISPMLSSCPSVPMRSEFPNFSSSARTRLRLHGVLQPEAMAGREFARQGVLLRRQEPRFVHARSGIRRLIDEICQRSSLHSAANYPAAQQQPVDLPSMAIAPQRRHA